MTGFDWVNPHVEIHFDGADDKGTMQHWTVEASNPYTQMRAGWDKNDFKVGDQITITFHPANKTGFNVGYAQKCHYGRRQEGNYPRRFFWRD